LGVNDLEAKVKPTEAPESLEDGEGSHLGLTNETLSIISLEGKMLDPALE